MAYREVADISAYQGSDVAYLTKIRKYAKSLVVKLTEGTSYVNPKASAQISNGLKLFETVSVYHFFHGYGLAEAKFFLNEVKKFGLDKSTVLIIDVEANDLPTNTTPQVNIFLKYLIDNGYKNVMTYGSGSWFKYGRINRSALVDKHIWVAAYGVSQPGVDNANAWQFSDNGHGLGVDFSYDFDGSLSGIDSSKAVSTTAVQKPSYYQSNGLYEVTADEIHAYKKLPLKEKENKRYVRWTKGSRFYAVAVKDGDIYSLKTTMGYTTANKNYVKIIKKI